MYEHRNDKPSFTLSGALAGWRRRQMESGVVLRLQISTTVDDYRNKSFQHCNVALNDRQLRSLARDLARAAEERGIQLHSDVSLLRRLVRRLGSCCLKR